MPQRFCLLILALGLALAAPAAAVDPECAAFDDPLVNRDATWATISLVDGFSGVNLCSPIFTPDGFRYDDGTYTAHVGECVVEIDGNRYAFATVRSGQFFQVFAGTEVFSPSGSVLTDVWCELPDGTPGRKLTAIATAVPVTEQPEIPLQAAP